MAAEQQVKVPKAECVGSVPGSKEAGWEKESGIGGRGDSEILESLVGCSTWEGVDEGLRVSAWEK